MSADDGSDRDAILARRREFLTVALATAGLLTASCDDDDDPGRPQVCLTAPERTPTVCLTAMPPEDAGPPERPVDAGTPDAADAGAKPGASGAKPDASTATPDAGARAEPKDVVKPPPRACLKISNPRPHPCLSPKPPPPKVCLFMSSGEDG